MDITLEPLQGDFKPTGGTRRVLTSDKYIKDKKVDYNVYLRIQSDSNWDGEKGVSRYIYSNKYGNLKTWANRYGISDDTLRRKIKVLKDSGLIVELENFRQIMKDNNITTNMSRSRKGLPNIVWEYEKYQNTSAPIYILKNSGHQQELEDDTIYKLVMNLDSDEIKIYLKYRAYCELYGSYKNDREYLLKEIGLNVNDRQLSKVTKANKKLVELKLIHIKKHTESTKGKPKTINEIFLIKNN